MSYSVVYEYTTQRCRLRLTHKYFLLITQIQEEWSDKRRQVWRDVKRQSALGAKHAGKPHSRGGKR
jgi:hypothetical protein